MISVKGTKQADPIVGLTKNGKPVELKDRDDLQVVVHDDHIEIKLKNPKRTDTGKWEMSLTNSGGTALAPFEMEVRDKPSAPKGAIFWRLFCSFFAVAVLVIIVAASRKAVKVCR